jgi:L-asparaginase
LLRGIATSRPRGVVVAATGSGNTSADLLAAATELMAEGTVVALTTRCPTGEVAPSYAFPGGGVMWQRAGALVSALDGPRTRVALALGIGAGLDRDGLQRLIGP